MQNCSHSGKNTICYLNSVLLENSGGCLCDALKYIEKAKKEKTKDLEEVVDVNILNEFDNVLAILD